MRKAAQRIVEKLRLHGQEAFFAGGWVRDHLMRRRPKDIDIATSATPDQVLALFPGSLTVGIQFGVVRVRMYGKHYEVATFRKEGPYVDGRHPSSVSFCGPRQDALRRDFTVNGLFYDPLADRVIDYVRGRSDLQNRMLRAIGDPVARFEEDRLRMLRAVRFAVNLGFEIDPRTWTAIGASAGKIATVSPERIRDEILQILGGSHPARGLDLLHESGLLAVLLPEVEAMRGVQQPPEFHPEGDVFVHTRMALALLRKPSTALVLGTLLHDVGKPPTFTVKDRIRFDGHVEVGARLAEDVCRRLRISNDEAAQVVDLVVNHLRFMHVMEMRESTLKRFLRKPRFLEHLELHRVDCLSSHGKLDGYKYCKARLRDFGKEDLGPSRLITGDDLIALGYTPGPLFRQILEAVEDRQLENGLATRADALDFVRATFPLEAKGRP